MGGGVVWLASYPKSGNTWLRVLLENWFANGSEPVDINALREQEVSAADRGAFDSATLLCSGLLFPDEVAEALPGVMRMVAREVTAVAFSKIHNAFTRDGAFGGGVARAAIYIVRDPRDVAVSLAGHLDVGIDDAISFMGSRKAFLGAVGGRQERQLPQWLDSWSGHVRSWLDQTEIPVHVMRYEDLVADPVRTFGEALAFVGESPEVERVERAVRFSSFGELRRQEESRGFRERVSVGSLFFRRGVVGGWREALTEGQARRVEAAHGEVMGGLGYGGS